MGALWVLQLGSRSLRLNFELDVEVHDPDLASSLDDIVANRIVAGREVTLADADARPIPVKLGHGLARILSPYL